MEDYIIDLRFIFNVGISANNFALSNALSAFSKFYFVVSSFLFILKYFLKSFERERGKL